MSKNQYEMLKVSALILAAGMGTRLRPLTNNIPKCLVEIGGKTMLDSWIEKLREIKVDRIVINMHYMHEKVEKHIANKYGNTSDIVMVYEESLLGTAGTILRNKKALWAENCIVLHCDNYYSGNLFEIMRKHEKEYIYTMMTMGSFVADNGNECGLIKKDNNGILIDLKEKDPKATHGEANAAVYILRSECLRWLDTSCTDAFEFTIDVIPKLYGKIRIHPLGGRIIDIGTPDRLAKANRHYETTCDQ